MRRRWIGVLAVAVAAAAIVANEQVRTVPGGPAVQAAAIGQPGEAAHGTARVLLFADPREAGSSCGCGRIIRLVREAAARGIPVREITPGGEPDMVRKHGVMVAPTVLILDASGTVVARLEGEESGTIESIRVRLEELEVPRP